MLFAPRALPPLRPDAAEDSVAYDAWVRQSEAGRLIAGSPVVARRTLHVVMVVAGPPPPETNDSLRSLGAQSSPHWELTVVVHEAWEREVTALLVVAEVGPHCEVHARGAASTFDEMLRSGLETAPGHDVALMFPGDVWAPDTVHQLADAVDRRRRGLR